MGILDIPKLKNEIDLSNKFCARVSRNFDNNIKVYEHEFEMIQEDYQQVIEKVKEQFKVFEYLKKIYFEVETSEENFSERGKFSNLPKGIMTEKIIIRGENSILAGLGTGLGVGAGAVGLMAAFGTASTGTAIASLTGAAKISALLAAFGGGSIASGGLGIAGGIAVLGAAVFIPAVTVAGYLAYGKVKSAHKEAMARKAKARRLEEESKIFFAELDKGVRKIREIIYDLRKSADYFQRLVAFAITSPEIGYNAQYQKLLRSAAQVMIGYGLLKVLDKDNKLNENLDEEFAAIKKSSETCFEHFIAFRAKISPKVLEPAERLKNLELCPLKDEEIRKVFDEAVTTAKFELDVTAMKLNYYMADKYIPLFRNLLDKGVKIKIFYGIGEEDAEENRRTNETAARLKKIFRRYPNFKMKRADTHAKIFICDDKFFVLSSYNVLSKDGDKYNFGEAGLRSSDAETISHHRKEYFDF